MRTTRGLPPQRPVDDYTEQGYLWTDGVAGSKATTPDASVLDITGNVDLRVACALNNWGNATEQGLLMKLGGSGSRSYGLSIIGGLLLASFSYTGTTVLSPVSTTSLVSGAYTFSNGSLHIVRATINPNDGAGNRVTTYYVKETTPARAWFDVLADDGWTQLDTVTAVGTGTLSNSAALLTIGGYSNDTLPATGRVYAAVVKSGLGEVGTLASAVNFSDKVWAAGGRVAKGESGLTYTIAGGAEMRGTGITPVSLPGLIGPVFTQVSVTTGEVAVPAANKTGRATVSVKALDANGANVYVGLTGVSSTTGFELAPGDSIDLDATDAVNLKAVSASGTQRVAVAEL